MLLHLYIHRIHCNPGRAQATPLQPTAGRILSVSASVDPFSHSHPLPPAPHVTASHCTTMPLISNQHSLCCKYRTALPFIVLPGQPISVQKPTWIVRMVLECCGTVVVTALPVLEMSLLPNRSTQCACGGSLLSKVCGGSSGL